MYDSMYSMYWNNSNSMVKWCSILGCTNHEEERGNKVKIDMETFLKFFIHCYGTQKVSYKLKLLSLSLYTQHGLQWKILTSPELNKVKHWNEGGVIALSHSEESIIGEHCVIRNDFSMTSKVDHVELSFIHRLLFKHTHARMHACARTNTYSSAVYPITSGPDKALSCSQCVCVSVCVCQCVCGVSACVFMCVCLSLKVWSFTPS